MSRLVPAAGQAAAVIAVAVAACGGEPEPLSADELVERGDASCREVQTRFDEIQQAPPATAADGAGQAADLLEVADDAQAELRDVEPPDELSEDYDRYLDLRQEVSDLLREGRDAAEDKDGAAYGEAQEAAAAGAADRQRAARELGFEVCSQDERAP